MTLPSARYHDLHNSKVLITGGASGIGAALAAGFASQGASVAFLDKDKDAGQRTASEIKGEYGRQPHFIECDLSTVDVAQQATRTAIDRLGGIDVLVNNVAWDDRHEFTQVSKAYWDLSLSVNLEPAFFVTQAAVDGLKASGRGAVINFSSIAFMMNLPDMPVYLTAKSAIIGLTKGLAGRLGADNIRVNAILPGMVLTPRQKEMWVTGEAAEAHMQRQCLKFSLEAEDMVGPCLFLASDSARAITAQSIIVDGGYF